MKILPLPEHSLRSQAEGFYEHLMQPEDWHTEDTRHVTIVQEALADMPPELYEVLLAIYSERIPYSQLGKRLGCSKTQAWRKAQQVQQWVKNRLIDNQYLKERYNLYTNWNDAAMAVLESYDRSGREMASIPNMMFCAREMKNAVNTQKEIPSWTYNTIGIEAMLALREQDSWNLQLMHQLLVNKQRDYGHDNILAFGLIGIAVRMNDKLARLNNLLTNRRDPSNETITDTYMDLVGYAAIADMLANNTFTLELENQ